jgi:hypothetical protein
VHCTGSNRFARAGLRNHQAGAGSEPRHFRPVNWSNCRALKTASRTRFFLLDNLPARSARKMKSGIHMFATIVGGALTLVFIGLPLAIIGLFIQSLLERRNKRPVIGYGKSKPIGSEHQLEHARPESESAPSQLPNTAAPGHRPGLATPIVARHHDARTSASARGHGRGERRGTIPDRHSAIAAPASPADRPAQASARDRRA